MQCPEEGAKGQFERASAEVLKCTGRSVSTCSLMRNSSLALTGIGTDVGGRTCEATKWWTTSTHRSSVSDEADPPAMAAGMSSLAVWKYRLTLDVKETVNFRRGRKTSFASTADEPKRISHTFSPSRRKIPAAIKLSTPCCRHMLGNIRGLRNSEIKLEHSEDTDLRISQLVCKYSNTSAFIRIGQSAIEEESICIPCARTWLCHVLKYLPSSSPPH